MLLRVIILFLVVILAASVGFGGLGGIVAWVGKVLFLVCLAMLVTSLLGRMLGRPPVA